jgi:hypothetical protein
MAPILTAEDVVRRIAAECTYIDDRGGVGIRLKPAAAIEWQYGEQFRRANAAPANATLLAARGWSAYLAAMAAMKSAQAAVDAIVRTWFHMVQSFR